VAFWSDTKIALFTSSSLSSSRGEASNGPGHYLGPEEGIFSSVDLTDKYLVASTATKGRVFRCYIFKLQAGNSVEPSLEIFDFIPLPLREIRRLAISPDNKRLACLLSHDKHEENPRSLFLANIPDLLAEREQSRLISTNWAAENSTHFSFANNSTIAIVMRLEQAAQSRGHMVPIILLSLSPNQGGDEMLNLQLQLPVSLAMSPLDS
jgi:hypothetical protein